MLQNAKKNKHKSQCVQINFKKNHQINTLLIIVFEVPKTTEICM